MKDRGSVSPLEQDNPDERGDGERELGNKGGDAWDKMMEPFDQDKEEGMKADQDKEEELWQEAFGEAAKEGLRPKVIRAGYNPTQHGGEPACG